VAVPLPPLPSAPAALYMPLDGLDVRPGRQLLEAHGIEVLDSADDPSAQQLATVVAVLAGYDEVGRDLFDRLPALRLVATHSAGIDMVDVPAARERGIWLANLPDAATEEVAAHALAAALALARRLPQFDREVRLGRWADHAVPMPRLPQEMTCGVVGMGRIGRAFSRLAGGVFGRVIGYDPVAGSEHWPSAVHRCAEVETLLAASDCVSLHVPLTMETHGLLDARRLALLPPGAILVNVSRGELIDEAALLDALDSGRLGAAACDVLVHEPPSPEDPMLSRGDVLLSPHVAYLSEASLRRYVEAPARNVLSLLRDGRPLTPVVSPA
jgi:phosphoglycerate dehydrogenase-like enzyme